MSDEGETTLETGGLDKLIKVFKGKIPTIKVGILGSKAARDSLGQGPINNAELGSFHEFGTTAIAQRSFLRVPITDLLDKKLESSGALDVDVLKEAMQSANFVPYAKKIGALAQDIVLGAFDSAGYGKWPAWKNSSYMNNAGQLLVDTQQLRNSISYEVKES